MGLELACYRLPKVTSTPCFRRMYDVIDDSTIALEWLDNTLLEVEYHPTLENYILIKEVLRAALTSCIILGDQGFVNMGMLPLESSLEKLALADHLAQIINHPISLYHRPLPVISL